MDEAPLRLEIARGEMRRARIPWSNYIPHIPTLPQRSFLALDCKEAFYGGAAGGGKTDALLMAALQYVDVPGYAAILFRKTYKDLSLPGCLIPRSHEWLGKSDARWIDTTKTWHFPKGSTLSFGHLETVLDHFNYQGSEFQLVGFDELNQHSESKYRYLFSRLRAKKGIRVPLRMRGTGNPGGVGHAWVKRRFVNPKTRKAGTIFVPARVHDNPHININEYVNSLQYLDEVTLARYLHGDWDVSDDNRLVYAAFDRGLHMIDPPSYDPDYYGVVVAGVDPGLRDPYAVSIWAREKSGIGWWKLDEFYKKGGTTLEFAPEFRTLQKLYKCRRWFVDKRFPTDIRELRQSGLPAVPNIDVHGEDNKHTIRPMLNVIVDLLKHDEFHISPKCTWSAIEYENYQYRETEDKNAGEVPIDMHNHLPDTDRYAICVAGGTLVATDRGDVPIEAVTPLDRVLTRDGYFPVRWAGKTGENKATIRVTVDGVSVEATPEHPFLVEGKWKRLDHIAYQDMLSVWKGNSWCSGGSDTTDTPAARDRIADTLATGMGDPFTGQYGRRYTDPSQRATKFTTKTETTLITQSQILSALKAAPTLLTTRLQGKQKRSARFAGNSTLQPISGEVVGFAQTHASPLGEEKRKSTMSGGGAFAAKQNFGSIDSLRPLLALVPVQLITESSCRDVYNLEVDGPPEFFANGILVHNCSIEDIPALRARYRQPPDMRPRERSPRQAVVTHIASAKEYLAAQEKRMNDRDSRGFGRRRLTPPNS